MIQDYVPITSESASQACGDVIRKSAGHGEQAVDTISPW